MASGYRKKAIGDNLNECEERINQLRTLIADEFKGINISSEDKRFLWNLMRLANISEFLVAVGRQSEARAKDCEDRMEELEKQMEELKKRFPVGDGK